MTKAKAIENLMVKFAHIYDCDSAYGERHRKMVYVKQDWLRNQINNRFCASWIIKMSEEVNKGERDIIYTMIGIIGRTKLIENGLL